MQASLHIPSAGQPLTLSPRDAGWDYCGLRIVRLAAGDSVEIPTEDAEVFVLPLTGGVRVQVNGEGTFDLHGRESVFTAVTDFLYVGRDSVMRLASSTDAEIAIPSARCTDNLPARYGPAADVPVEVRGAGPATRQVTNFGTPDSWPHAQRLMCCELITPPGNWSSYPPHKHDISPRSEAVDEEIYYYRIAGADQRTPAPAGFGVHITYTGDEHAAAGMPPLDERYIVRDGDVVLVPYGYHGPCIAAPGYPMYYLNVLAGPGAERSMAFCDDAAHAWIRDDWAGAILDPRCPVTSADGPTDHPGSA